MKEIKPIEGGSQEDWEDVTKEAVDEVDEFFTVPVRDTGRWILSG